MKVNRLNGLGVEEFRYWAVCIPLPRHTKMWHLPRVSQFKENLFMRGLIQKSAGMHDVVLARVFSVCRFEMPRCGIEGPVEMESQNPIRTF